MAYDIKEQNKPMIISKNTLMPISMVTVLIGGVVWLTIAHAKTNELVEENKEIKKVLSDQKKTWVSFSEKMNERHTMLLKLVYQQQTDTQVILKSVENIEKNMEHIKGTTVN